MRSVSGYTRSGKEPPEGKRGQVSDLGSVFTTTGFGTQTGYFGAWDPATGELGWQKRWPESCYSGTVTTAGGLVFVGRNSGELEAYDAHDGALLWSFQTGAGANSTVTVFAQAGKQYIAFLAGGNALAATPHGDNLWLFSLDGKLGPAKPGGAGKGTGHAGESTTPGDPAAGEKVFADNCSGCHGLDGHGGNGGPSLAGVTDVEHVVDQVTHGGGGMPAFGDTLSAQEIQDVAAYVTQRVGTSR
jgi:mono/diheme cytochrome c family protein